MDANSYLCSPKEKGQSDWTYSRLNLSDLNGEFCLYDAPSPSLVPDIYFKQLFYVIFLLSCAFTTSTSPGLYTWLILAYWFMYIDCRKPNVGQSVKLPHGFQLSVLFTLIVDQHFRSACHYIWKTTGVYSFKLHHLIKLRLIFFMLNLYLTMSILMHAQ